MRKCYVQIDGVLYDKDALPEEIQTRRAPAVFGDIAPFKSSIDGAVITGRRELAEHCKQHNVVPFEEVRGLPHQKPPQRESRAARIEDIQRAIYQLKN